MIETKSYIKELESFIFDHWTDSINEPVGRLKHPFLNPGGKQYANALWDWDSWVTNMGIRYALKDRELLSEDREKLEACERGCLLNFAENSHGSGFIPTEILPNGPAWDIEQGGGADYPTGSELLKMNPRKPCYAQHLEFVVAQQNGECEWFRERFSSVGLFLGFMRGHRLHESGLYVFANDVKIGVDDDPCTFGRPPMSSASIYLNALMFAELEAAARLAERFQQPNTASQWREWASELSTAIQAHCWDERDRFFYSADVGFESNESVKSRWTFHSGRPRQWKTLPMRIGVWSGILPLWAGIATPGQAKAVIEQHLMNDDTFNAPFGIRSLSAMEPMYSVQASGNPSCWLGPVWTVVNWFAFKSAQRYGFEAFAMEIAEKTIRLLGEDLRRSGTFHEYYEPDTGVPMMTPHFKNWNLLVMDMIREFK